jgi:sugar phosphate isomerase/epimerase
MGKNTEDNVRRLRPGRAWSEQEALSQIRREACVEVASIAALGPNWRWQQSRAAKAVTRWERAGHIIREQGAGGKIVIRVHGHERQEQGQEGQERVQETQESGQEHVIDPPQGHGVPADVPGVPAGVPAPLPVVHAPAIVPAAFPPPW